MSRAGCIAGSVALAAVPWLVLAGCGDDFDPGSRVVDFRLLAVAADSPYAAPGEVVDLATLWHEPFDRPVWWAWTSCVNPPDSTAAGCLAALVDSARGGEAPQIVTGDGMDRFSWTVPDDALSALPAATRPNGMAGILTVACPGALRIDPFDEAAGADGALPFGCSDADTGEDLPYERFVVAVRRVFIREADRNLNPAVADITWDGEPWPEGEVREADACAVDGNDIDDCEDERHHVSAVPAADSVEVGVDEFGGEFAELVIVQYYATSGVFEFEARTAETAADGTDWAAGPGARGQEVELWFVVRDNRGGVGWTSRRVRVR